MQKELAIVSAMKSLSVKEFSATLPFQCLRYQKNVFRLQSIR